mgnify:CR=1 FL=1|jgi:hypothetical protein
MEKNIKYKKQSLKERFEKKILDQSMAELIRLNEYFKAKKQHKQNIRDFNEAKRLKNQNLYHHEYERIKNYLESAVVHPHEIERLEKRKKEILVTSAKRSPTKYDELLNKA